MKYLKLFNLDADYQAFIEGEEFVTPNLSGTKDARIVYYNPIPIPIDYSTQYLTFTALEDGMTVSFEYGVTGLGVLKYSFDGGDTWTILYPYESTSPINSGEKIIFKGDLTPDSSNGIGKFSTTKKFDISGNIMSLLYGDDFVGQTDLTGKDYALKYLFDSCKKVVNAKDLILPATTLVNNCYNGMFMSCSSLTSAPELPATTLVDKCYYNMFAMCTSLNYIKMLATDISANNCLDYWVMDVSSTGTFVKSAGMNIPSGTSGIPKNWTVVEE